MSQSGTPLESLLGDLASPNYRVRWKAVQGLGEARDPRALRALARCPEGSPAHDPDRRALGPRPAPRPPRHRAGDRDARRPRRQGPHLRRGRAQEVRQGGPRADARGLPRGRARGPLRPPGRPGPDQLAGDLRAADRGARRPSRWEIRLEAARVLGVRKDRRAVDRLLRAVAEGGPHQFFYIRTLGEIGDPRAFEPLQALLTAPEFMLRQRGGDGPAEDRQRPGGGPLPRAARGPAPVPRGTAWRTRWRGPTC